MSLTKKELIEKNKYELQFSVDKETFDAAVTKVYKKQVSKINIPGFRKGKAPKAIIEKMYGTGFFYEDAINDLIPAAYTEDQAYCYTIYPRLCPSLYNTPSALGSEICT